MTETATVRSDFAARLYDKLAHSQAGENLFLSPFSIQVALAMCAVAARGATRKALAELIGAPERIDEQNRQYAELLRLVHSASASDVQLMTANALWGQQGCRFRPEYKRAVAEFYDGDLQEVDFVSMPDQAAKTINAWVEGKTAGRIKELIKREVISPLTRLILTNAIYFKGKWDREFDKQHTQGEDWHGAGGVRKVPMMQQRGGYLYHETDAFQALDLPYRGQQLSMLIVLPRKTDGLAALEGKWAAANTYQEVTTALRHEESVIVSLPRFKMESAFALRPALCALGAGLAFSDDADFAGLTDDPLKIAEVVHKAFVEVNEEGTEAAAATGVVMAKRAVAQQPRCFLADHPFLFVIRDRKTNAMLFCGRVLEPK